MKQHNLQVSGGEATLVARVLRYVRAAQQIYTGTRIQWRN